MISAQSKRPGRIIWLLSALLIMLGSLMLGSLSVHAQQEQTTTESIGTLRVGLVLGENLNYSFAQLEPFRLYLEQETGLSVHIAGARSYGALMANHKAGRVHYAIYSASAYARAWSVCRCIEPLVVPKSLSGGIGIHSVLIVPNVDEYQSLSDLNGRRVLYTASGTLAGHLLPARAMSLASGTETFLFEDADIIDDLGQALGALQLGNASGVFGWQGSERDQRGAPVRGTVFLAERAGLMEPGFTKTIWRSALVPHGPHAVLSSLPAAIKSSLTDALLKLDPKDDRWLLTVTPQVSEGTINGTGVLGEVTEDENARGQSTGGAVIRYRAADILDRFDLTFGGGFAPIGHYDYLPVLNVLGWGSEGTVPNWP